MNNLKKYAGLLNDAAPKGEFLAYINEDEAEMLKENGALGLLTPQGIPSYIGGTFGEGLGGKYQGGSGAPGSAESSGNTGNTGNDGNGGTTTVNQFEINNQKKLEKEAQDIANQNAAEAKAKAEREMKAKIAAAEKKEKARIAKEQDDAKLDYLTGEYLDVKLNTEQKKEFEKYRTGVRESITPSTKTSNKIVSGLLSSFLFPFAGTLYNGYLDATAMGYKLQNPFANIFGSGGEISVEDVNNLRDQGGDEGNRARSQLVQNILKITNPNLPSSQVNQYFNNNNINSNFDFAKDYALAKSKVAQTLNNRGSMGMLAVTNSPYYDWLKTKNLDKGIL